MMSGKQGETSSIRRDTHRISVNHWWKRPFDLAVLITSHITLAPIWIVLWTVIPLSIWLHDRGPVFYTQKRYGKGGKVFELYKFRSMVPNAEQMTGPVWASEEDPRITPVGRFLRNRALDELPQVINIWKGDISLVGPRAERPELADEFTKAHSEFADRLAVRPGLTGVAQVYGRYATAPMIKLRYDMLYIRRASPLLDIKLLLLSVWVTLTGRWQAQNR